ncbi:MAG TPA: type II toxin-antitoxin system VapC family toxin [Thermoanaerobaculia bacterium]|jgi:PIN domain nuclease of toxin-antitoxin system
MRFLIDTHCWLWGLLAQERLNDAAKALLEDGENTAFFSTVSAAEIGIKVGIKKLELPRPAKEFVVSEVGDAGMKTLPLYMHHTLRVADLPLHHRDPFDRLLIAQAQAEGLPLMTADPKIAQYDVEIIWAGREEAPPRQVQ